MEKLSLKSYQEKIVNKPGVKLIKFGADWCGPCRAYNPVLREIEKNIKKEMEFYEVDVDLEPDLAEKFNIKSVPATFIIKNGKIVKSFIGMQNSSTIMEILDTID